MSNIWAESEDSPCYLCEKTPCFTLFMGLPVCRRCEQDILGAKKNKENKVTEKTVATFAATICVGLREGYDGPLHDIEDAEAVCKTYCDEVGLCVVVAPVKFFYTKGAEPGAMISLINYPRFPSPSSTIKAHSRELARRLMEALGQLRVSVVCSDETFMLEKEGEK